MRSLLALAFVLSVVACKKDEGKPADKPAAAAATQPATAAPARNADGTRTVPIEVVSEGYKPDRIVGQPGEKLKLVFTRRVDGHCYEELKTPEGKLVMLPKDKPFEVDVTVPTDGEVKFACGMDMLVGVIVAEKKS